MLTETDFAFLTQARPPGRGLGVPAGMTLQDMEKVLIIATLQRTSGNIKESASILGIDRSTLYEKIKRYEIPAIVRILSRILTDMLYREFAPGEDAAGLSIATGYWKAPLREPSNA